MFSRTKTVRESFQHFQLLIGATYDAEEARSISQIVFKEVLGYDTIKLILNENELLPAPLFEQLDQIDLRFSKRGILITLSPSEFFYDPYFEFLARKEMSLTLVGSSLFELLHQENSPVYLL